MEKTIFCARCQSDTPHSPSIVGDDYEFTCACGHFVKFPTGLSVSELRSLIGGHKKANTGLARVMEVEVPAKVAIAASVLSEL